MTNLVRNSLLTLLVICCFLGCSRKSDSAAPTVSSSKADPEIQCTFVEFGTEPTQGRFAVLDIENLSDRGIANVRGTVKGFGADGSEVYTFPWSASAAPELIKAKAKIRVRWGFNIPESAVKATFVPSEIEVVDEK